MIIIAGVRTSRAQIGLFVFSPQWFAGIADAQRSLGPYDTYPPLNSYEPYLKFAAKLHLRYLFTCGVFPLSRNDFYSRCFFVLKLVGNFSLLPLPKRITLCSFGALADQRNIFSKRFQFVTIKFFVFFRTNKKKETV